MIDKVKVETKLNSMKLSISRLKQLKNLPKEVFLESFTNFDSAKYNLITAVEAMIDICNHIISRENYVLPATSSESIEILVKQGILPAKYQHVFIAMVKFRNKAVHLYAQIKDEEVYKILQENLGDFDVFITAILKYVYENGGRMRE
jgi:uncharacterized protein YutE (UPF0331/DUF86 family)